MDIEEFVKDVLGQVTRAVNDNKSGGKTSYNVNTTDGVSFDLAVTTASTETKSKGVSGGMKVKVIGAEGMKSSTKESKKELSSRVQFKVDMYTYTDDSNVVSSYDFD